MAVKLDFGVREDGEMVHISRVPPGLACGCYCPAPDCRRPLVAKFCREKRDHFAHAPNQACLDPSQARMTELHYKAQRQIQAQGWVMTPERHFTHKRSLSNGTETHCTLPVQEKPRRLEFDEVEYEPWRQGLRPDLVASLDGRDLWIEIKVAHGVDSDKYDQIRERSQPTLEVDLSRLRASQLSSDEEIAAAVNDPTNGRWVYHSRFPSVETQLKLRLDEQVKEAEKKIAERKKAREKSEAKRRAMEEKRQKEKLEREEAERIRHQKRLEQAERRREEAAREQERRKEERRETLQSDRENLEASLFRPDYTQPWKRTEPPRLWVRVMDFLGWPPARRLPTELENLIFRATDELGAFYGPVWVCQVALFRNVLKYLLTVLPSFQNLP